MAKQPDTVIQRKSYKANSRVSSINWKPSTGHRAAHSKSRMLLEFKAHNASPSDSDTSASLVPSKKLKPSRIRERSFDGMTQELDCLERTFKHSQPLDILSDFGVHVTRTTSRALMDLAENRPISPRKNLNLAFLSGLRPSSVQEEREIPEEESEHQGSSSSISEDTDSDGTRNVRLSDYSNRERLIQSSHPKSKTGIMNVVAPRKECPPYRTAQQLRPWEEWVDQKRE